MKKFCFILLFLCLLLECAGSSFHLHKNTDRLSEVDTQISGAATPYYAPLCLAREKGYFKEEGLQVNFYYASATEIVRNVGTGNVLFGFPNVDIVLSGRGNGVLVSVIHTTYREGLRAVTYGSESDVRKIQNLKGRTVTITSYGSPNYIQLKVILQQNGLFIHGARIKVVGTGAIVNALVSSQVDAICLPKLRTYEPQSSGIDAKQFLSNDYVPSYENVVITLQTFLKEHPEIYKGFTSALNRGMQDTIEGQMQEAVDIAKEKSTSGIAGNEQKYMDIISQEFVKDLWVPEGTAVYGYGYSNLHDCQIYIDLLQKNGLFKISLPTDELIVQPGGAL